MKKIGTPTTLGEFRKLTDQYPDETLLQFRNEPVHELIDIDGELCFQDTNPWNNGKNRIGIIGYPGYSGWDGIICGMDEARTIVIRKEDISKYPDLPESIGEWESGDPERYLGQLKLELSFDEFKNSFLNHQKIIEHAKFPPEAFEKIGENMIDHSYPKKKKNKGYERPYKFHK